MAKAATTLDFQKEAAIREVGQVLRLFGREFAFSLLQQLRERKQKTLGEQPEGSATKQFRRLKEKYPGAILFFRMGDFCETLYEDAQICSRVLGITLTSRSTGSGPIPLAGVPCHAMDGYVEKMLQAGHKVVVIEPVKHCG